MPPVNPEPNAVELKQIIEDLKKPHVLRNLKLNWSIFRLTFEEFQRIIASDSPAPILFDIGNKLHADLPFWERFRTAKAITPVEFFNKIESDEFVHKWATYSYKDINLWPEKLKSSINFNELGFENAEDVLFWLGTAGANTPCHYDTYGFNIVVQIFGRKSWLLFPPGTPLQVTRVPYEESSVYCKENFYSPFDMKQFRDIHDKCYRVILEPGDILIVPPKWWHYVENLDVCLAVNTWIPLGPEDDISRLEECFVRMQVEKLIGNLDDDTRRLIYNPNEISDINVNLINILQPLAEIVLQNRVEQSKTEITRNHKNVLENDKKIFQPVQPISSTEFYKLMELNGRRFNRDSSEHHSPSIQIENVINSICNPLTIHEICENYLKLIKQPES